MSIPETLAKEDTKRKLRYVLVCRALNKELSQHTTKSELALTKHINEYLQQNPNTRKVLDDVGVSVALLTKKFARYAH